jgi:2-aminoethylphosphonate-pyruvate transaminase
MIGKAIVLARPRARINGSQPVDALTEVGGRPLLARILCNLEQAGISDAVVISPEVEALRTAISQDSEITLRISWVDAAGADSDISALKLAAPQINEPVLLMQADTIFCPEMLAPLVDRLFTAGGAVLVERSFREVYDLAQVSKVVLDDSAVVGMGDLERYDAVATGITVMSPELIGSLRNEDSLQHAIARVAIDARLPAQEVNGARWHRVNNAESRLHAEWLLRAYGDGLHGIADPAKSKGRSAHAERTLSYIEGLLSENQAVRRVLMNPGPVLTSPRVKSALVHHDICHRDEDYAEVCRRVQRKIRRVCRGGPEHEVLLLSGSGTAAMEATLATCVPAGGKLLVISNGAFGERFAEVARAREIPFAHLRYAWGDLVDPNAVRQALVDDDQIVAVVMCHHETSVGLLNPVHEVGGICRELERLFFVDAISSLGAEDVHMRRDKIDVLICSANKALHAISGVSFVCLDSRVWAKINGAKPRTLYLDLNRYRDSKIPFTPAVSNIMALDAAIDEILREGIAARMRHYRALNRRIRRSLRRMGLHTLTNSGHEAHSITTISVPAYTSFEELYEMLKGRGYIVYACKEHLFGKYFQIANMGELSDDMVDGFLHTLQWVLQQLSTRQTVLPLAQASL